MGKENVEVTKKPIYKKWWFWVIVVVIVAAVGSGSAGSSGDKKENANTKTEAVANNDNSNETKAAKEKNIIVFDAIDFLRGSPRLFETMKVLYEQLNEIKK